MNLYEVDIAFEIDILFAKIWRRIMKFIKQLSIILTISLIAELMEYLIPLPVAASIYGLVLMLLGLITKIIPLEKVEGAADFLVEILPIMFIPPTVGIMTSVDALKEMLVPLCVISVVSTVLIMTVTGRVSQRIIRKNDGQKKNVEMQKQSDSRNIKGSSEKGYDETVQGVDVTKEGNKA